jgi:hypothetical protein
MNDLIAALHHLLGAWLAEEPSEQPADQGFTLREVGLDSDGFRLVTRVDAPSAAGELIVCARIEAEQGGIQRVHFTCERCPERLPELLAAIRPLLESARLILELDFRGEPARA